MSWAARGPDQPQLEEFVAKLDRFRDSLSPPEQRLLDAMLLLGCLQESDVQAYWFDPMPLRRPAMLAARLLNDTVGGLQVPNGGLTGRLARSRLEREST
jgi:hypothetical protein